MRATLASRGLALPRASRSRPAPARRRTWPTSSAELTVLNGQIEQLRDELVRSGAAGGLPTDPATALTRLDQLEAELRRLTDRVDVLTNDIARIVEDATNRVGDIEFRLTELEGGDTSVPAEPEPLGGGADPAAAAAGLRRRGARRAPGALAVSEQADFDAAVAAADAGDNAQAAQLFATFLQNYPGGPLSTEAQFRRGEALAAQSRLARRGAELPRHLQRRAAGPAGAARALPAGGQPRRSSARPRRPA